MKTLGMLIVTLVLMNAARAAPPVTFDMPTSCSTYCTGYTTNSSLHTVNYVTDATQSLHTQNLTVGFDSVAYSGPAVEIPVTPVGDDYYATITGATLTNANGGHITVDAVVHIKKTSVSSGRAHYTIYRHWVQSGKVGL